jgi:isopropylmalate/homocitrate/citramalate synthase
MSKILLYPKCAKTFIDFCHSEKHLTNKFVNKLRKLKPFDVTLRDGLQGLSKEQQLTMKPVDMLNLYFQIKEKYQPRNMEIGSIVSSKVLPIFKNSDSFYNYIEYCQLNPDEQKINNFILIPNETQFNNINKFIGLNCFSFITSVSESFQMKNTKMTLDTTFQQINNMMRVLDDKPEKSTVKLYVSCINECPIEGKIDNNVIIEKIQKYQKLKPNILCLSDTCGTLTSEDLNYIILNLQRDGIKNDYSNLSLHLHVKPGREDEVEQIIHTALDFGINSFDVSALKSGGCSVTMNESDLAPNLSYELYYKSLFTYLLK